MSQQSESHDALGLCDHCGMPLKVGTLRANVAGRLQQFCCYGCFLCQRVMGASGTEGSSGFALARMAMAWLLGGPVMALSLIEYVDGFGHADAGTLSFIYWLVFGLASVIVAMIGLPYLWTSLGSLFRGRVGSDLLIAIGALSAYGYSSYWLITAPIEIAQKHLYFDSGSMVLVLVSLGKYIEAAARRKTTGSLSELSAFAMAEAIRIGPNGEESTCGAETLTLGDIIKVLPGATVPADAVIIEGESAFSEALLTGEFRPVERGVGSDLLAGSVNGTGLVLARVRRSGAETTAARIVALAKEALMRRTRTEVAVDRVARFFIPAVLVVALGAFFYHHEYKGLELVNSLQIALSILVVACPCALGLATPLSVAIAIHRGAEMGMLFRSGEAIERLAAIRKLYLDKTGTLTTGAFAVSDFFWADGLRETQQAQAEGAFAALEAGSEHWIGQAIRRHFKAKGVAESALVARRALPGVGIEGMLSGERWWAGKSPQSSTKSGTLAAKAEAAAQLGHAIVWFGKGDEILALVTLRDEPKPNALAAIRSLKILGLELAMVTGDHEAAARPLASELGIPKLYAGVLPSGKLQLIESEPNPELVGMTGDGVNDGPALMAAGVGVTFAEASGLARLAAGVTLVGSDLRKLPNAMVLARRTSATIRLNLFWAFSYNAGAVALGFFGLLRPEIAALAMLGSSVFVVTRSWKLYRFGDSALRG